MAVADRGLYHLESQTFYALEYGDGFFVNPVPKLRSTLVARGLVDATHSARNPQYRIATKEWAEENGKPIEIVAMNPHLRKVAEEKAEEEAAEMPSGYRDPFA